MYNVAHFGFEWEKVTYTVVIYAHKLENATIVHINLECPGQEITLQNKSLRIRAGIALCNPKDTYDWGTGVKLACRSALSIGDHGYWNRDKDFDRILWRYVRVALNTAEGGTK
jgi:hypothetical protein